ncbi:MAG: rhomboid family intramembrane serine protease [Candidatus Eremiobacteraeota bacterium]|nr:rhomboid family intramembrane serine protease [Candidatus Eremiobacteraeota bacterium]
MIVPIGDINERNRTPYVNCTFIAVNVLVYLFFIAGPELRLCPDYETVVKTWGFIPAHAALLNAFTSCFLHGGFFHLLGNMIFLWIFGDNVEDAIGHIGYALFYLAGGIGAAYFHGALVAGTAAAGLPAIGASGAISAVMGAYLVFFPRNKIVYWYLIWYTSGTFKVASGWAIGFWFVMQFVSNYFENDRTFSGVAYGAHLGGFILGAVVGGVLLISGIVKGKWDRNEDPQYW